MRTRMLFLTVLAALLLFAATPARADGIIVPQPPICDPCPPPCRGPLPCPSPIAQLAIRYHHVTVTIRDQVAVTHVDQVFFNPNDWAVEGTYVFPLPADAVVSSFTLWIDGKPVEGQVLDAGQARQKYLEIVYSLRDPALLEYIGQGAIQASIFPIPPGGERRIELEYSQALAAENGLVRYVYPLNTEKFSAQPLEDVAISVEVASTAPIRAAYSPTHDVAISREGENRLTAGYEAKNVTPDSDFVLYYSVGESEALHLLTYRDPADAASDGYFLLLLAPKPAAPERILPKDVILVLDRSGSMEGEKFRQAQDALVYILQHLNPEDRFNVIAFSTGMGVYAPDLRPAEEAAEAQSWVERLSAQGSTDINRALLEAAAMADRERPTYLIFLTDGLPTLGVVESGQILANLEASAPGSLRLFAFGVGYDVDTFLLDSLAQAHHGNTTYVVPGERLDETLSAFYAKISTPVLTGLDLDFGPVSVYDVYPSPLPDLFSGSQIIVAGRYRQGGTATITLSGQVDNNLQVFPFPEQAFPSQPETGAGQPALARLWATRKIGYLLNQVRLKGPDQETIDQIVRLSVRYGIVTPYTSYLVTEPFPLGAAEQGRIAGEQFDQMQSMPTAPVSGQAAVEKAAGQSALSEAEVAAAPSGEATSRVKILGSRAFVFDGTRWVDSAFDPDTMLTTKVAFLSAEYYDLLQSHPDLAAAFALGQQVIAISQGQAYEVLPAGDTAPPPVSSQAGATPVATPPVTPVAQTVPTLPTEPTVPAPSRPTCLAGLLPLALTLVVVAWPYRRQRGAERR